MTFERLKQFGTIHRGSYNVSQDMTSLNETDVDSNSNLATSVLVEPTMEFDGYPLTPDKGKIGRNTGSYDVTLPRNTRRQLVLSPQKPFSVRLREVLCNRYILIFFALLLFIIVGFCVWSFTRVTDAERLSGCDVITNTSTDAEMINSFIDYLHSFEKHYENGTLECSALSNYADRLYSIESRNSNSNDSAVLGLTSFTDLSINQIINYCGSDPVEFEQKTTPCEVNNYLQPFSHNEDLYSTQIYFDDSCSLKMNVMWSTSQWATKANASLLSKLTVWSANETTNLQDYKCAERYNGTIFEVFDNRVHPSVEPRTDVEIEKQWIYLNGPFVKFLTVSDHFFDYTAGIFTREECASSEELALVHVIVIGFGVDSTTGMSYWEIQPVGNMWKQWGERGIMRLEHGACSISVDNSAIRIIAPMSPVTFL